MTKNTTKKTTAKKQTEPKAPEPMDTDVREQTTPTAPTNQRRPCWAIKTLVAEMHSLFPDVPVEYSNYNGRNTALDVSFDLTVLDNEDAISLIEVMSLLTSDERVASVVSEDEVFLVSIQPNPRTQDSREPFRVAEAFAIATGAPEADQ